MGALATLMMINSPIDQFKMEWMLEEEKGEELYRHFNRFIVL
jgi:hypothetical protein